MSIRHCAGRDRRGDRGDDSRGGHVAALQALCLPYESEYTAHRNDERAGRVMRLRLKAREHVKGPAIMPDLADMDHMDPQQKRKRLRLES